MLSWISLDSCCFFFFKQKTAYEMRISDWSSDVCSSDLVLGEDHVHSAFGSQAHLRDQQRSHCRVVDPLGDRLVDLRAPPGEPADERRDLAILLELHQAGDCV